MSEWDEPPHPASNARAVKQERRIRVDFIGFLCCISVWGYVDKNF
jgi:hypothetical protein